MAIRKIPRGVFAHRAVASGQSERFRFAAISSDNLKARQVGFVRSPENPMVRVGDIGRRQRARPFDATMRDTGAYHHAKAIAGQDV
jgi:hypothetical protein